MGNELRRHFFPYCLRKVDEHRYILLNRDYKPLGIASRELVDYATHPSAVKLRLTARQAIAISYKDSPDLESVYLYNDGCVPTKAKRHMDAYLARLALLMKLKARP